MSLGEADKTKTVILSGLSEGDVIAKESGATSTGGSSSSSDGSDNSKSGADSQSDGDRIHLAEMRQQQSSREEI